jgi:hypothetical protein
MTTLHFERIICSMESLHKLIHPVGNHLQFYVLIQCPLYGEEHRIFLADDCCGMSKVLAFLNSLSPQNQFNSINLMPFYNLYLYVFVIRFTTMDFKTRLTRLYTNSKWFWRWCITQIYCFFGLFPSSSILENTTFRKLHLFPSSGEGGGEDTYSVGPLRKS